MAFPPFISSSFQRTTPEQDVFMSRKLMQGVSSLIQEYLALGGQLELMFACKYGIIIN